jgi:hypothetical protein
MNKRNLIVWMTPVAVLLAGFATVAPITAKVAEAPDSEQVSKLLSDAKTTAFQLKEDGDTMETFGRMNLSWESHAMAINQIKDHVNALAREAAKLKDARNAASPWQKTAIDRIGPYLEELGGYTTAIIERINGDKTHTVAQYQDYLEANADYASDLCAMITDFVDYGKARQRVDRLSTKLEIPSAGK